jgi:protein ImuA
MATSSSLPSSIAAPFRAERWADLQSKIEHLEGFQRRAAERVSVCDIVDESLPYKGLPLGCIHEVSSLNPATAIAFAALLSTRIERRGSIIFVAPDRSFYPLGLLPFGIQLQEWLHVTARQSQDLTWTLLEAMRCPQVKAVLAVTKTADLNFCRRLQLAAESSGVTGFLIHYAKSASIASVITRWRLAPLGGCGLKGSLRREAHEAFWKLELLYSRGGKPGQWTVGWVNNKLQLVEQLPEIPARPMQRAQITYPASSSQIALAR